MRDFGARNTPTNDFRDLNRAISRRDYPQIITLLKDHPEYQVSLTSVLFDPQVTDIFFTNPAFKPRIKSFEIHSTDHTFFSQWTPARYRQILALTDLDDQPLDFSDYFLSRINSLHFSNKELGQVKFLLRYGRPNLTRLTLDQMANYEYYLDDVLQRPDIFRVVSQHPVVFEYGLSLPVYRARVEKLNQLEDLQFFRYINPELSVVENILRTGKPLVLDSLRTLFFQK